MADSRSDYEFTILLFQWHEITASGREVNASMRSSLHFMSEHAIIMYAIQSARIRPSTFFLVTYFCAFDAM